MALTFKTPENYGYEIAELFGTKPNIMSEAKALGVLITQPKLGDFTVKHPDVQGTISTIFVKGQAISLAKNGAIGPGSKNAIADQFNAGLQKAINKLKVAGMLPKTIPASQQSSTAGAPQSNNASSNASTPAVPLSQAAYLYQPVTGTSPGSVYRVFALYPALKAACRLKGSTLSIRIEGSGVSEISSALTGNFYMEASKLPSGAPYISGHYGEIDDAMFRKALGAVVGVLGSPTSMADFAELKEMF